MYNKPKKLEDLISEIKVYFKDDRRVADHTICSYRTYWRKFERYLLTHKIVLVDATVCKNYLSHLFADRDLKMLTGYEKMHLMVVNDLIEFQEIGAVLRIKDTPVAFEGSVGEFMTEYIVDRCSQRYSQQTLYMYRLYLSNFLNYLVQNDIRSIKDINELHLLMFFKKLQTTKAGNGKQNHSCYQGLF